MDNFFLQDYTPNYQIKLLRRISRIFPNEQMNRYGQEDYMNHIMAVCDGEEPYASRLVDYLNTKDSFPFDVRHFSDMEKLREFSNRICILVRVILLLILQQVFLCWMS